MKDYKISIIFSILEDFITKKQIASIEEWGTVFSSSLLILLLDGVGIKEFTYMEKTAPFLEKGATVSLVNPLPNTRKAYQQMFFRGKESIETVIRHHSARFLMIDNRAELSLFGDAVDKIHRKSDDYALLQAKKAASNYDIIWVHLMMADHISHDNRSKLRSILPVLSEKLNDFISTLPPRIVLILGDHGPHQFKTSYRGNLSRKERTHQRRESIKLKHSASKTCLKLIKIV
ncbi:MAG: hypothetical protein ACTSQE_00325 [Candidatus Heimdallarchaeaceae archaeon]